MSVTRIASRYAKSLFNLVSKKDNLERVHEDILYIREVARNKEFSAVMKNPLISVEKKENIVDAVFKSKVDKLTLKTLMVLVEHKREAYLLDFCNLFHTLYNTAKQVTQVVLTVPVELSEEKVNSILAEFQAKKLIEKSVELEVKIDPTIIGGFIIQFNDQLYDSSVKNKLDQLKKKFSANLYIKNI